MIKWSYSSLKKFLTCPRQYHEVKILKNYEDKFNLQASYGLDVHKAFENYIKNNIPLPENYSKYQKLLDVLNNIPGTKFCELKLALDINKQPCGFEDDNYWVRGIGDLFIVNPPVAFIIDYKTGSSRYADIQQLKLLALLAFAHFPDVQNIKASLVFVGTNALHPAEYTRKNIPEYWQTFNHSLERLLLSHGTGQWPASPSGLCKRHCAVASCEYHG